MKRLLIAILAFLYLGLASGVVMNVHYCMGKLSSVEYGSDDHRHCGNCGMEEKSGCCNTEMKIVKLQDSHQLVKTGSFLKQPLTLSSQFIYHLSTNIYPNYQLVAKGYESPPDCLANKVYLYTGILRI